MKRMDMNRETVQPLIRVRTGWILLAAIISLSLVISSTEACPKRLPTGSLTIDGRRLFVEIAATPAARTCGLSKRPSLPKNRGMLFIYPAPQPLVFWMKDTVIPLSIAFIDKTGRIVSIQKMTPVQTAVRYRSPKLAPYALEVNQGWFDAQKIKVGSKVDLAVPMGLRVR
jgi:uncharacterized membrane protein (UPF0127 family)